ncbi:MAG: YggT family protein [Chloroflexota bacterium]|nr:YggT family protein [Chloroflexota bacterium]
MWRIIAQGKMLSGNVLGDEGGEPWESILALEIRLVEVHVAAVLLRLINVIFTFYSLAFIARALLSWVRISYYHPVARFLVQITEPVLAPLRRYIPPISGMDFTPMVALLILWFVEQLLQVLIIALF